MGTARDKVTEVSSRVDHSFIGASADDTRKASLLALTKTFEFIDSLRGGKPQ